MLHMLTESLPEIPRIEHPEHDLLKKEAEAAVVEKVAALDIGLDLEKHPELLSRLAEIGSHFQDSVDMARIIRAVYGELKDELGLKENDPSRMMRAALLHDVGKSGPPGDRGDFHFAVRRLFVPPLRPFNPFIDGRAKTVSEFMAEQDVADVAKVSAALEVAGIAPEKTSMIDFWRRHAEWTYGILKEEPGVDVDADLVKVAATHHLLEHQNPAGLEISDIPAEAQVLEVLEQTQLLAAVDKYQAFRARGGMRHEDATAQLAKIVDSRPDLPRPLRDKFKAVIGILDRNKKVLEEYFKK
jgi:hypothetical protein